jgi:hypothetical protein
MHANRQTPLTRVGCVKRTRSTVRGAFHAPYRGRRGYAMLLVLIFIVLFLTLLGTGWRYMGSAVRIATARSVQIQRDEGSIHALAKAMRLLETGLPPTSPYICGALITTSSGPCNYTVTFTSEGNPNWSVHCSRTQPSENPPLMPDSFAPQP